MATWTPTDLTYQEFVDTKLTPLDRSNALRTMLTNVTLVESKLVENKAAIQDITSLTNNEYSFGTVRDARRAAQEAQAAGSPNAAELQKRFEELKAKRDELTTQADRLRRAIDSGEEAIRTSQLAINNLERAGAVPPGTNQFTPPPGYTSSINPPAQVPESQNPNPTPPADNQNVTNSSPVSTDSYGGGTQDEANAIAQAQKEADQTEYETQVGATQGEADAIAQAQKEADQTEYETQVGATQGEADAIAQAQNQKQAEEAPGATQEEADFINQTAEAQGEAARQASRGIQGAVNNTREQAIIQDTINFNQIPDWRVRLSLAPNASYLYKSSDPGILKPLQATNGVLFPYTPSIGMSYSANYSPEELIHSNYKIYQYKNSAVEQISISADFTAQDAKEAAYVLAVIHFFRSVTKMFYGKDQNPKAGVPPPLCFIYGMGDFQFNQHPLLISGFSYNLPNDVDYIRAGAPTLTGGQTSSGFNTPNNSPSATNTRMQSSNVPVGGKPNPPNWTTKTNIEPTYIPTKLQLSITALPVVTRKDISDNFSLKDYSTGSLLRGRQNSRGGIW